MSTDNHNEIKKNFCTTELVLLLKADNYIQLLSSLLNL